MRMGEDEIDKCCGDTPRGVDSEGCEESSDDWLVLIVEDG